MKFVRTAVLVACLALPAHAEEESGFDQGMSLLQEGANLLMRSLIDEMEPALRELSGALEDLNAYHPPEVLPNGDIIIRRRTPLDVEPEVDGEIEL